tara:strand:+ start:1218 stop:2075 length:858 start_codon:yes stop_codon:yes gene_type:complete
MKLLVVGDFHGSFPKKFETIIKKEKIDLVVSNGDYPPFHYRKLWFKHCYGKDVELWEVIGKKKYKEIILKDMRMAERALKKLDKLPVPVFTVLGNIDYPLFDDGYDLEKIGGGKGQNWSWDRKNRFLEVLKKYKNIKRFDYKSIKYKGFVFIGGRGHSNPGLVKSKGYKKYRAKLDKLFGKFRKENKEGKVIFVTHNVPYNTKLDKIGKGAHELVRGKHYGSKMFRRLINKYQPVLHVGGHIHESRGKQMLGKTLAINPGAAHEGNGAIVELPEGKGRVKVRFIN